MIDPVVRRAAPHDVDDLAALEQVARARVGDQRGGRRWLDEHPERAEQWSDVVQRTPVFVGVLDEVVVGYLVLTIDEANPVAGVVALVDEVFVLPEARQVGFGDELLAAALAAAQQAGAAVFEGIALPGDRETKNLYERAGITARSITVSTRLSE